MTSERGATLLEAAITSMIAAIIILAVGSAANQSQKRVYSETDQIELQQKGRVIMETISFHGRAVGADRSDFFSNPPYTTTSQLPIPQASSTMIRLRSDYDDDGAVAAAFPEDVTISWTSGTKTLLISSPTSTIGTFRNINNFVVRYYDTAGTLLTPPGGGWDITTDATHGTSLRSIGRIQFEVQLESRHPDPDTKQFFRQTVLWDLAVRNQFITP
jgi:Tfp pilus assembly protein PilW